MTEKTKIDWNQLTTEPISEEQAVDIHEDAIQASIDWSLFSTSPFEPQPVTESEATIAESTPETLSKKIDWAELTQSSEE